MEDCGKAKLLNTSQIMGRPHYSLVSAAGEAFSVVRPEMGAKLEREMRQALKGILNEELDQE
jgi:hypothetical protein